MDSASKKAGRVWREELFTCLLFHFFRQDSSEETPPTTQNFIIPKKEIHTVPDMGKWKRSQVSGPRT
jgi:hypothetical protein